MQENNTSKISNWILWAPLKFGLLFFGLIFLATTINAFVLERFFTPNVSQSIFIILISIALGYSAIFLAKKLPIKKMDRKSFISLHIAQTLITTICFYILTYFLIFNMQSIMFKMTIMAAQSVITFFITMLAFGVIFSYITGVYFSNLYAKFRRIQDFNIPTWKIILSLPFGFSALWVPGFLLDTNSKQHAVITSNKKYNKLINWTLNNPTNTVSVFIFITLFSILLFGVTPVLLTFIFALIYGIWTLQIGAKKFNQIIPGKYSTTAIIINVILILTIIGFSIIATPKPDTMMINISDTHEITETIQG